MEDFKAPPCSNELRKKVSKNGTEDQNEGLMVSNQPEESYQNKG